MTKFEELLKGLNEKEIIQKHYQWLDDIPSNLSFALVNSGSFRFVTSKIDVNGNKRYDNITYIYVCEGRFLSIKTIFNPIRCGEFYEEDFRQPIEFREVFAKWDYTSF